MRKPSFKQEWVLSIGIGIGSVTGFGLNKNFTSPLFLKSDNEVTKFLLRMVSSGWIEETTHYDFFRLSEKSKEYMKNVPKKDYHSLTSNHTVNK